MFSLTIVFGPGPMVWTLMFKTKEKADDTFKAIQENVNSDAPCGFHAIDDFSQEVEINVVPDGVMLEDLEQSRLAHIERALHQARTQAKGQEIADADPTLRQARMKAQGGMPMIQPMSSFRPNGGFPG